MKTDMNPAREDHRIRVTRMLIRKALTDLLQKKPLQSITIKELCAAAGINRGTFYAHYTDIYDLIEKVEAEMFRDLQKAMEPLFSTEEELSPVRIITGVFQCLKDNADICAVTLGDFGDKNFALKVIQFGQEKCIAFYSQFFEGVSAKQIEYFYAFVSAGCISLLKKWLTEDMADSAEDIAHIVENIILHGIGFLKMDSKNPKEEGNGAL
jgi:AcrR family transcriptional regulator